MRDRTAEDGGVQDAGWLIIVRELASAEQEAPIFRALYGLADERIRASVVRRHAHRPRSRGE
jgi:hypothetical protein